MKLLSIQVGKPRSLHRPNGTVRTAIYKEPVLSCYEHWRRELSSQLPFGQFGENLTVEGMPESEVRIGDVYRIASAVLQVSQPRSPCYKLALKMERPDFARAFLASGHPGFYLRVLEEGEIGVGDSIELVEAGPPGATVARVARRLFGGRALATAVPE